jgi:hypothetical protein
MTLRKLTRIVPVVAVLALAAPVAAASAATTPATGPAAIPCYPYPAFCGPNGQPWWQLPQPIGFPIQFPPLLGPLPFNPLPVGPPR